MYLGYLELSRLIYVKGVYMENNVKNHFLWENLEGHLSVLNFSMLIYAVLWKHNCWVGVATFCHL